MNGSAVDVSWPSILCDHSSTQRCGRNRGNGRVGRLCLACKFWWWMPAVVMVRPSWRRLAGAKVLRRPGERGRQLQAGVAAASGDVLIFVSPGTRLPADALEAVRIALADTKVLGGVFACSFAGGRGLLARVAHGVLGLLGLTPFGAPVVVWRTAAEGEGTIERYRVFEDRDLLRRLHRNGTVTRLSSVAILDSRHGLHRFFWTLLQLPYDMGFSPRILGKLYHKPRSSASQRAIPAIEAIEERELIRAEPAPT